MLASADIFGLDPDPQVTLSPHCLNSLANYTPQSLRSFMTAFGGWLDSLSKSALFGLQVPFVDKAFGDAIGLKSLVDQGLTKLETSGGQLAFSTIKDFLADLVQRTSPPTPRPAR